MLIVIAAAVMPTPSADAAELFVTPASGRVGDIVTGCPAGSRPTHQGVDISQNANARVYAAASGTVTTAVNSAATTGYGSQVVITHADGYTTRYAHLVNGSVAVTVGTRVAQGAPIGIVGSTGQSTGPHLHFEILRSGGNVTNTYFYCGMSAVTALTPLTIKTFPVNADMNGDRLADLLAVSQTGQLVVYTGNGRGGWGTAPLGYGWGSTRSLIRGDFDGDGRGDIMAVRTDGTLWFYRNLGQYGFRATQVGSGWNSMRLVSGGGDFTGDRRADLVAVGTDEQLYVYPGNGVGGFTSRVRVYQDWSGIDVMVTGDFVIDGRADIMARDSDGRFLLFRGNGAGVDAPTQVGQGWGIMTAITGGSDYISGGPADIVARDAVGDLWVYPWLSSNQFGARVKVGHGWNIHRLIH